MPGIHIRVPGTPRFNCSASAESVVAQVFRYYRLTANFRTAMIWSSVKRTLRLAISSENIINMSKDLYKRMVRLSGMLIHGKSDIKILHRDRQNLSKWYQLHQETSPEYKNFSSE